MSRFSSQVDCFFEQVHPHPKLFACGTINQLDERVHDGLANIPFFLSEQNWYPPALCQGDIFLCQFDMFEALRHVVVMHIEPCILFVNTAKIETNIGIGVISLAFKIWGCKIKSATQLLESLLLEGGFFEVGFFLESLITLASYR